ncbi:addiction module antidote protein [Novosphingobium sp. B 225]|uniref:addiction module antidote protein n=1 Tax=Novosphingobium sp. B 225 TaxID=1961849 RepID=UPI000B4BF28A|nr:addiction module antidote protein [Novosphingobium sp. B 225]
MSISTKVWDAAEFLGSDSDIRHYLEAAFEDGDPALIRHAFNTVARARGMTALSRETGISREALYKAFGENGNPTLDTLLKVTRALGVRLAVAA